MIGLIFLWMTILYEPSQSVEHQADAYALSFVAYRNAVNQYALTHKVEGIISLNDLTLPPGLKLQNWSNRIVAEGAGLRCYVYGAATVDDVLAVQMLLRGSAAIGWNKNGNMQRQGPTYPLPNFIPAGDLVSVINLD